MGDVREYQFVTGIETSSIPDPGTPAADASTISLGYAEDTYAHVASWGDSVQTVAAVKAIAVADRYDNQVIWVDDLEALFKFDSASSATGDDATVITPTTGTGRWLIATTAAADGLNYNYAEDGFQDFVIEDELTPVSGAPGAGEFRTFGIVGRANCKDLSDDLKPRMGVERIITPNLAEVAGEAGPNGELVYKIIDDYKGQIRLVGGWTAASGSVGNYLLASTSTNDFMEIIFYGTGLNLLFFAVGAGPYDLRATVDGGAEGANFLPNSGVYSTVLNARNYATYQIVPVTSGLSIGIHSVKIRQGSGATNPAVYGIEILNESSNVKTATGSGYISGTKTTLASLDSVAYNTTFAEILRDGAVQGSLGTKGARVLVYLKSDGTIAKKAVEADATPAYTTSANHTYEELQKAYHFREFGVNRSDDFAGIANSATTRVYTLSDNTFNLNTVDGLTDPTGNYLGLTQTTGFWAFTFVGTGIDLVVTDTNTGTSDNFNLDGTNIGTYSITDGTIRKIKIASGLTYGTHVLYFNRTVSAYPIVREFHVYVPKKPELPTGAVELAEYYIPADFSANATAGVNNVSVGVIRKAMSTREAVYVNGTGGTTDWTIANSVGNLVSGQQNTTDRTGAYVEMSFFGTGFDLRFRGLTTRSANIQVLLNGTLVTAGNFGTASFSTYGAGVAFNTGTGILDQQTGATVNGCGFVVSGLPLGFYTLRLTNNTATEFLDVNTLDVITPIHSTASRSNAIIGNTHTLAHYGPMDTRELSPIRNVDATKKILLYASGVSSGPNTTVTTQYLIPNMCGVLDHEGGWVELTFIGTFTHSTGATSSSFRFNINGTNSPINHSQVSPGAGTSFVVNISYPVYLAAGKHFVQVLWSTAGGTLTASTTIREFYVTKLDWSQT